MAEIKDEAGIGITDEAGSPILDEGVSLIQEGFRFRNDDGSESAATWKASQDVNVSLATGAAARIRALINAIGDTSGKQFKLEYRYKPSGGAFGSWAKVN